MQTTKGRSYLSRFNAKLVKVIARTIFLFGFYEMVTEHFYDVALCKGKSMEPTINDGDIILLKKRDKYLVKRGDILVVRNLITPKIFLCKRAVGLENDVILTDKYSGTIPVGSIWLQGDNSYNSFDSRHFGPIPKGLIIGKAVYRLWPSLANFDV